MLVLLIQVPGTWAVLRFARWHVKWQAAVDVKLDTVVYASDRHGRCLVLWMTLVITNTVCSQIGAPLHRAAIAARAAKRRQLPDTSSALDQHPPDFPLLLSAIL